MSGLFDALRRSEAERSGLDLSALSEPTKVLRLAELHATAQARAARRLGHSDTTGAYNADKSHLLQGGSPTATAVDEPADPEPGQKNNYLDPFSQFKSIEVSVRPSNRLVCLTDRGSLAGENFRFLGVRLQHLRRERPLKTVLITSPSPQEGKSTISANLACALARRGQQKILLLEGDERRPSLSSLFELERLPGICDCLQGDRSLFESIYHLEGPGFWIMPAGSALENPLELLQSRRLPGLMDQLATWFDWIIIDSPPVLPLADTSIWMRVADGILLVTRQGSTERRQLERAVEALDHKKLIGAVLNCSRLAARSDYYYYRPQNAVGVE